MARVSHEDIVPLSINKNTPNITKPKVKYIGSGETNNISKHCHCVSHYVSLFRRITSHSMERGNEPHICQNLRNVSKFPQKTDC